MVNILKRMILSGLTMNMGGSEVDAEKCPPAASGLRVLRLNVQEVRLGLNPRPSFVVPIAAEGQCNGSWAFLSVNLANNVSFLCGRE